MSSDKPKICFEKPKKQTNAENSQFIQRVHEEDRRNKILENVFMRSTEENPNHKRVQSIVGICTQLKEEQRQRFLEEKRRQQLRENNQELKLLETQLRAAYVKKAVGAQIFEKEAIKDREKALEHQQNKALELARLKREEAAEMLEEKERSLRASLMNHLKEQISWSNANKMKKYELMLKEKERIDEVMRKCREDKEKEDLEATERKIKNKSEMDEFKRAQEECKIAQSAASELENERIMELLRQRDITQKQAEEEKRAHRLRKEQISEEIGKRNHAIAAEKAKERECLVELLIDERHAKEEMQLRKQLNRNIVDQLNTRLELELDRKDKEQRKMEQKRLDEEQFQEEMRLLAERDKLHQLSDEKRRRKQVEHRRALQESLDEKKRTKAEHVKNFLRATQDDLNEIQRNQQLVEEERIRMIKEHASGLLGYLAPGVLRDSDREFLTIPPKQN